MPFRGGVLLNDTAGGFVTHQDLAGAVLTAFEVPRYADEDLLMAHLPTDFARQGWGRGLAVFGDLLIAGSSPATIAVHDLASGQTIKSVNVTMDVRNAVHGLELWPDGGDSS
jgi:hypothetical protein